MSYLLLGAFLPSSSKIRLYSTFSSLDSEAYHAGNSPPLISELIWAATMAWALENTPCKSARLLAIYDQEGYSKKLVRYFRKMGFYIIKEVGSNPGDLFLRLIWGGAGTLMRGECESILKRMEVKFEKLNLIHPA